MSSNKMTPFLTYPFNSFLMVRLELVMIFRDDLQAKVLRVIESHAEAQRAVMYREAVNALGEAPDDVLDIPRDIVVPISYKLLSNDLYGVVKSDNTFRSCIDQLVEVKVLYKEYDIKKKYAPPSYMIQCDVLQALLNMVAKKELREYIPLVLEQLRKTKLEDLLPPQEGDTDRGVQKLIPSKKVEEIISGVQKLNPSGVQKLIPSKNELSTKQKLRGAKIEPIIRLDTNNNNVDKKEESVVTADADDNAPSFATDLSMLSNEDILKELSRRKLLTQETHTPSETDPTIVSGVNTLEETFSQFAPPVEETAQPPLFEVPAAAPAVEETQQASIVQITNTDLIAKDAAPAPTKRQSSRKDTSGLTQDGAHMRELWQEQTKRKIGTTAENVKAFNGLGEVVESDLDFNDVYVAMKKDPFYVKSNTRITPDLMNRKYDGWIEKVCEKRQCGDDTPGFSDELVVQFNPRIEKVFAVLDSLARETTGDKEFVWRKSPTNVNALSQLIEEFAVTEKNLRLVYMAMYNTPEKDGFSWKQNMSIPAICRQYDSKLFSALSAQKNERRPNNSTLNPPVEPVIQPTTRTFQLRRVSREAVAAN